jgi:hypothetical protein
MEDPAMLVKVKATQKGTCRRGSRHVKGRKGCYRAKASMGKK